MRSAWCTIVSVLVGAQAVLSISPRTAVVKANSSLRVTCNDRTKPLDKCFFRVWLENDIGENPDSELLDFSRGSGLAPLTRRRNNNDINFKGQYVGEGLDRGECVMNLSELTEGRYFVGCRVHVKDGEWSYDYMSLVVHSNGKNDLQEGSSPYQNQTVNNTKDSRPFIFNAPDNLQDCKVFLPEKPEITLTSNDRKKSDRSYEASLEGRKCSVMLRSVTLRSSGLIWALYRVAGEEDWKAFPPQIIYVNAIPGPASLTVDDASGENVTATCTVPPGRPAVRLRWEVDGKVEREDKASLVDDWYWPWDSQPVTQNLAFKVDRGMDHTFTCRVFHPDFNNEMPVLTVDIAKSVTTPGVVEPATPTAPNTTTTPADKTDGAGDPGLSGGAIFGIIAGVFVALALAVLGFFGYKHRQDVYHAIGYRQSGSWLAKEWEEVCILNAKKLPADNRLGRESQEIRILDTETSPADADTVWEELCIIDAQNWPTDVGSSMETSIAIWKKVLIFLVKKTPDGVGSGNAFGEREELHTLVSEISPIDAGSGSAKEPILVVEKSPAGATARKRPTQRGWDDVRIFIDEKSPAVVGSGRGPANNGEKKVRILTARKAPTNGGKV